MSRRMNKCLPLIGAGPITWLLVEVCLGKGISGGAKKQSSTGEPCAHPEQLLPGWRGWAVLWACKPFKPSPQRPPLPPQVSLPVSSSLSQEVWEQLWEQPRGAGDTGAGDIQDQFGSGWPLCVTWACHSLDVGQGMCHTEVVGSGFWVWEIPAWPSVNSNLSSRLRLMWLWLSECWRKLVFLCLSSSTKKLLRYVRMPVHCIA